MAIPFRTPQPMNMLGMLAQLREGQAQREMQLQAQQRQQQLAAQEMAIKQAMAEQQLQEQQRRQKLGWEMMDQQMAVNRGQMSPLGSLMATAATRERYMPMLLGGR